MLKDTLITSLTPEQEAQVPIYVDRYVKIGLSTAPCDREKAEAAIRACYAHHKHDAPRIEWCDSPSQGIVLAAQYHFGKKDVTQEQIAEMASKASYGSFEAYAAAFYSFIAEQLPVEKDPLVDIVKQLVENCGVYWTMKSVCVVTEKPVEIHLKDNKLHNPNGLALAYKDGTGVYAVDGVPYPSLLEVGLQAGMDNSLKIKEQA